MRQTEITKYNFQIMVCLENIEDVALNGLSENQNLERNRILKDLKKIRTTFDKMKLGLKNKK